MECSGMPVGGMEILKDVMVESWRCVAVQVQVRVIRG